MAFEFFGGREIRRDVDTRDDTKILRLPKKTIGNTYHIHRYQRSNLTCIYLPNNGAAIWF